MRKYPLHVISGEPDEYGQIGTSEPDGDILAAVYVNDRRMTRLLLTDWGSGL